MENNSRIAAFLAFIRLVLAGIIALPSEIASRFAAVIMTVILSVAVVGTTNANSHLPDCKANPKCLIDFSVNWKTVTAADMQAMIDAGANINAVDSGRNTSLHNAMVFPRPDIISTLIKAGANVNAQEQLGGTPLHLAVEFADVEIIPIFIKAGADLSIRDKKGNTPMDIAKRSGNSAVIFALQGKTQEERTAFPSASCNKTDDALIIARNIVEERLLSPSTADFPWSLGTVTKTYHQKHRRCVYRVKSYVDAQNVFGATIRNKYRVTLVHYGANDWKIDTVQMY